MLTPRTLHAHSSVHFTYIAADGDADYYRRASVSVQMAARTGSPDYREKIVNIQTQNNINNYLKPNFKNVRQQQSASRGLRAEEGGVATVRGSESSFVVSRYYYFFNYVSESNKRYIIHTNM